MKQLIYCFVLFLICSLQTNSQWAPACSTVSNWSEDAATRLKVKGEYVYVTGVSYSPSEGSSQRASWSIITVKYSTDCGIPIWSATYSSSNSSFMANGIDIDDNGNVYVVGTEYKTSDMDMITIKYNSSGIEQWSENFDFGGNDRGNDIGVSSNGNVYICGASYFNSTRLEDMCILAYNSSGSIAYGPAHFNSPAYGNLGYDEAYALTIDENGWDWGNGVYIAGGYDNGQNCGTPCYTDAQIVHYRLNLTFDNPDNFAHYGCYPPGDDYFTDIEVSSLTGKVYGVGTKYCVETPLDPGHEMFVFMTYWEFKAGEWRLIDYSGATTSFCSLSRYYYESGGSNIGTSLQVVPSGGEDYVYATGTSTNGFSPDIVTYKCDDEGNKLWVQRYNSGGVDFSPSISVNSSYVFVTGARSGSNLFLLRYPLGGGSPCVATYSNSDLIGGGSTIGLIGSNVYITGSTITTDDYLMLKYSQNFNCNEEEDKNNISSNRTNYQLKQNYPNPFNPSTNISYVLPKASLVSIKVFNTLGQTVLDIPVKYRESGEHSEYIDASLWSSGIYFYNLVVLDQNGNKSYESVQKMLLIK